MFVHALRRFFQVILRTLRIYMHRAFPDSMQGILRFWIRAWSFITLAARRSSKSKIDPKNSSPSSNAASIESWTSLSISNALSVLRGAQTGRTASESIMLSAIGSSTPLAERSPSDMEAGLPNPNQDTTENHLTLRGNSVEPPANSRHEDRQLSQEREKEDQPQPTLAPILPYQSNRYDQGIIIPKENCLKTIRPLTLKFDDIYIPAGWARYVQAEGQPYYSMKHKHGTYITEANIGDSVTLDIINLFINHLEQRLSESIQKTTLPSHLQIILERLDRNSTLSWGYYMVSHNVKDYCIFWLDEYDLSGYSENCGLCSLSHWKLDMLVQYWEHCQRFPHCIELNDDTLDELLGILTELIADQVTSGKSTHSMTRDDLSQLLNLTQTMKSSTLPEDVRHYFVAAAARIMGQIMVSRFSNFYGQHGARLDITQTVPGMKISNRTYLIRMISPFLFFAPDRHLEQLQIVDNYSLFYPTWWSQFIAAREKPWNDYILYATVLLAVNLSYLAVPTTSSADGKVTVGQVASLCSIITSIGCIVIGLLLVNEDRTDPKTGDASLIYLNKLHSDKFGYEPLAILYSLPFSLLMWSMITFVVSMGYLCFQVSEAQRITTACVAAIVLGSIAWEVLAHWKSSRSTGEYGFF